MTTANDMGGEFTPSAGSPTFTRMGYGAMQLAGPHVFGPPKDRAAAVAVLRAAVEAGVDHIDTSDFYGPHVTNQIIREALHPYPRDLTIVTKIGALRGGDGSWNPAQSPDQLRSAVHDNLRNLGLDALEVVNLRVMDPGPLESRLEVLIGLKDEGLVRHIGVSNVTPGQVAQAEAMTEIVCVQNQYNVAHRGDDALIDDLAARGVAYVPFFPLGGFSPLQSGALDEAAKALDATPMQTALAWLLHRSPNILLIPGTSSVAHLHENLAAASIEIPADVLAKLDAIAG